MSNEKETVNDDKYANFLPNLEGQYALCYPRFKERKDVTLEVYILKKHWPISEIRLLMLHWRYILLKTLPYILNLFINVTLEVYLTENITLYLKSGH